MAGMGPPPKDPAKRVRRNAAPAPLKLVPLVKVDQPHLRDFFETHIDKKTGKPVRRKFVWPQITRDWWQMWADSPLSKDFTATDWAELLVCAKLHAEFWRGNTKVAAELRLRVSKFGATPEDRLRLRIQFAIADDAEQGRSAPGETQSRWNDLKFGS